MEKEATVKFMNDPPSADKIAEVLSQCLSEQFGMEIKYTACKKKEEQPDAV